MSDENKMAEAKSFFMMDYGLILATPVATSSVHSRGAGNETARALAATQKALPAR